jgi:hypothetical protein
MSASALAFRPVVKEESCGNAWLMSGGLVLLLDVVSHATDRCAADGPGEVRPGTRADSLAGSTRKAREFLQEPPG